MNNFKTNDDLIKELLSLDEQKELQEEIEKTKNEKEEAVINQKFEKAAELRDTEKALREKFEKEVKSTRGGARVGAGRKKKDSDNILQFQVRVSKREKEFLKYARAHNLNYDDLMQG